MAIKKLKSPTADVFSPRHSACAGCGMIMATRTILDALGSNTIMTNATGCSEVTTTQYPNTFFKIPWIHSLFENAAPLSSGVLAALKYQGRQDKINVVAVGGDGATFDIGLAHLSGLWERGENILYICYDNEAYQNTGYQSSGATPYGSATTTTPAGQGSQGSPHRKKDMIAIALAHHLPYVATASIFDLSDIKNKIKTALAVSGPKYLQIYCPCVPGWGIEPKDTMTVAKLAVESGFYPIVEYVNGHLKRVSKISNQVPVVEFLKLQKRFKHLFDAPAGKKEIDKIQKIADDTIKRYGLME